MLPLVIHEKQIFSFEFWFNGSILEGMHYNKELFCKLKTFDIQHRYQAYHLGCKLAQGNAVIVLTCAENTCSLWCSLRASLAKEILLNPPPPAEYSDT